MIRTYLIKEDSTALLAQVHNSLLGLEGIELQWITKNEIYSKFKKHENKCNFIFSYFNGESYDYLREMKMSIFGPQLVLHCLRNDESLPKCPVPMYSTAMKCIVVSFTGINKEEREKLSELVIMMSGTVIGPLTEDVNVLIAGSVGSKKYECAGDLGLKIMKSSWVKHLWQVSGVQDPIEPWDSSIMSESLLPILHGLIISVTGYTDKERSELKFMIEQHGAMYMPDMEIGKCSHLIAAIGSGKKCNYALKWKVPIVSISWITDSIERGYYQNPDKYKITVFHEKDSSTPLSSRGSESFSSDISSVGMIKVPESVRDSDDEMEHFNAFFADCVIDFVDCDETVAKKWTMEIELHGGRTSNENVTHRVVVNNASVKDDFGSVKHVTVDWLQQCVDQEIRVDETPFLMVPAPPEDNMEEWSTMEMTEGNMGPLHGITVVLDDSLTSADKASVTTMVVDNGGTMSIGVADEFWLVVAETLTGSPKITHRNVLIVTVLYVLRCTEQRRILSPDEDFLFRPVLLTAATRSVLAGSVLSISGYGQEERPALRAVCKAVGATVQEVMSRRPVPAKGILATTHLVIAKVDKQKYPSSRSWRIPAVTKHWIGACVAAGHKVSPGDFLLVPDLDGTMQSLAGDVNLNETCFSVRPSDHARKVSLPAVIEPPSLAVRPPSVATGHPAAAAAVPVTTSASPSSSSMADTTMKRPSPMVVVNKHLHIRNPPPATPLNQSFGNLDSPIRAPPSLGPCTVDMDNLRDILRTPDYCANLDRRKIFTTPDIERGLKARLEMLNVDHLPPVDLNDFSFSDKAQSTKLMPLDSVLIYLSKSVGNAFQLSLMKKVETLGGNITWIYNRETVTHVICNSGSISDRNRDELEAAVKDGKKLVTADWLNQCCSEFRRVDEEMYLIDLSNTDGASLDDSASRKRKISAEEQVELVDIVNVVETRPGVRQKLKEEETVGWQYGPKDAVVAVESVMDGDETQLDNGVMEPMETTMLCERVFMFTSLDQEEKLKYQVLVEQLGGRVVSGENIGEISHLVCMTPSRGEKFLTAMAAGKWIVHKSYLDAVAQRRDWVDEREFEFGGPRTEEFLTNNSDGKCGSQERSLAAAANRWREIGGGAFKEWRVGIVDSEDRLEKLGNIIECGGGTLVPMNPLPNRDSVTHVLVNKKKCPGWSVDLAKFPCYKMELIQFFLTARSQAETKKITKKLIISPEEIASLAGSSSPSNARVTRASRMSRT